MLVVLQGNNEVKKQERANELLSSPKDIYDLAEGETQNLLNALSSVPLFISERSIEVFNSELLSIDAVEKIGQLSNVFGNVVFLTTKSLPAKLKTAFSKAGIKVESYSLSREQDRKDTIQSILSSSSISFTVQQRKLILEEATPETARNIVEQLKVLKINKPKDRQVYLLLGEKETHAPVWDYTSTLTTKSLSESLQKLKDVLVDNDSFMLLGYIRSYIEKASLVYESKVLDNTAVVGLEKVSSKELASLENIVLSFKEDTLSKLWKALLDADLMLKSDRSSVAMEILNLKLWKLFHK